MRFLFLMFCTLFFGSLSAQDWVVPNLKSNVEIPVNLNKKKRDILLISETASFTLAVSGLNQLCMLIILKAVFIL